MDATKSAVPFNSNDARRKTRLTHMNIKEFTRQRLEESAAIAEQFWSGVKNRLTKQISNKEEAFELIDIQEISDDCVDLIMLRKNKEINLNQLEHCRIVAENRLFRKPKIKIYFTSGPFAEDFFNEK